MRLQASCILVLSLALPALCQLSPDDHTTFLCHFDRGLRADYCAGDWAAAAARDATIEEGKFGGALRATRRGITYQAEGNLDPRQATIEMWVQSLWRHAGDVSATLLSFKTDTDDYLNFNVIYGKRLGFAIRGGGKDWVWRRVDVDITDWDPTQWRHLAATWGHGEMRFFVDGAEVGKPVSDIKEITGAPETFILAAGDMRVDELRISNVPRSAQEIAADASAEPAPPAAIYLSDLEATGSGAFRLDGLPDRAHLAFPLLLGDTIYARGIGMIAPASVEIELPEGYATLVGRGGVCQLSEEGETARMEVLGDGKSLWTSAEAAACDLAAPIAGVRKLQLVARPNPPAVRPLVVWGDLMLLREGATRPPPFQRALTETDLRLAQLKRDSTKLTFELPDGPDPYVMYAKNPFEALEPGAPPQALRPTEINAFASRGEFEPVVFLIAARENISNVLVAVSDLRSDASTIPAANIDIRTVLRGPQRRGYWLKRDQQEIASRFLMPYRPFDLNRGHLQEIYLDIEAPRDAQPGTYEGLITVTADGAPSTEVRLRLRVLPIDLPDTKRHRYGMYYQMRNALENPEKGRLELQDMRRHGCTTLWPGIGVRFLKEGEEVRADCSEIREAFEMMREAGYAGTVPVHDGVISLARTLGHKVGGRESLVEEGLEDDPEILALAKAAFDEAKRIDAEFPNLRVALTHMDEVFNRSRLPLYIQIAKIVRKTTDLPLYITMHTSPRSKWEEMMAESDPYIDIRCTNGHALDDWLRVGHSFAELAKMGEESGDELWTYYNMRGSFFTPEWCRIVNGYYLWLSPLTVHIPWMYYSCGGDPFDDTDSDRYDFGYAMPSPEDGMTPVPTLHWKAFREGVDDMRYLELLEYLIAKAKRRDPKLAKPAEDWLKRLRGMMPRIPEDIADIEGESPVLIWISQEFTGEDCQRLRYGTAEQIMRLQETLIAR